MVSPGSDWQRFSRVPSSKRTFLDLLPETLSTRDAGEGNGELLHAKHVLCCSAVAPSLINHPQGSLIVSQVGAVQIHRGAQSSLPLLSIQHVAFWEFVPPSACPCRLISPTPQDSFREGAKRVQAAVPEGCASSEANLAPLLPSQVPLCPISVLSSLE